MANPFENIRTAAGDQDRSFNWYMRAVKKMANNIDSFGDVGKTDIGKFVSSLDVGKLYMFSYDPKMKDSLPYYDKFPLCLPFDTVPGGFLGLNLHYLAPIQRAKLLGTLLEFTDKEITEDSKIQVSWSILKNFGKFPQVKPSIKRYIATNVNSRFVEIEPQHWKASIFLPTQRFVGASARTVYTNSNKAME